MRIVTIEENTGALQKKLGDLEAKIATLEDLLRQVLGQVHGSSAAMPAGKAVRYSRQDQQDLDNNADNENENENGGDDPDDNRQPNDNDENNRRDDDDDDDDENRDDDDDRDDD